MPNPLNGLVLSPCLSRFVNRHGNEAHIWSRTRDTRTVTAWKEVTWGARFMATWWRPGLCTSASVLKNTLLLWTRVTLCCWASKSSGQREEPRDSLWRSSIFNSYLAHLTLIKKHSGLKGATTWISKNKIIKPFWFIKIKDTLKGDTFSTRQ